MAFSQEGSLSRYIWCTAALIAGITVAAPLYAGGRNGPGGRGGLPGLSVGPDVSALQPILRASDEEWTVLEPILQRLVAGVDTLRAADAGTLANADASGNFAMGDMSNDSFSGPSNIAAGDMGLGMMFGPKPAKLATTPAGTPSATTTAPADPAAPRPSSAEVPASSDTLTLAQALTDLKAAVAAKASDQSLKERLAVVRDARAKTQLEVQLAGQELQPLLTLDQEAALVSLGYLK